jgi:hypothetical protein
MAVLPRNDPNLLSLGRASRAADTGHLINSTSLVSLDIGACRAAYRHCDRDLSFGKFAIALWLVLRLQGWVWEKPGVEAEGIK